jgi:hypothetical protein
MCQLFFEHNHRNLSPGLLLVVAIGRIKLNHLLPELDAFFACRNTRAGGETLFRDLHLDGRVGQQIQVPARLCIGAAFGTYYDVSFICSAIK